MPHSVPELLTKSIIDEAIVLAKTEQSSSWQERIEQMSRRIARLHEQAALQPQIPTELQDAYRTEIDTLTLENIKLHRKLDQTREALERARQAYKNEMDQTRMLQSKMNDLEKRLLNYLNRQ